MEKIGSCHALLYPSIQYMSSQLLLSGHITWEWASDDVRNSNRPHSINKGRDSKICVTRDAALYRLKITSIPSPLRHTDHLLGITASRSILPPLLCRQISPDLPPSHSCARRHLRFSPKNVERGHVQRNSRVRNIGTGLY